MKVVLLKGIPAFFAERIRSWNEGTYFLFNPSGTFGANEADILKTLDSGLHKRSRQSKRCVMRSSGRQVHLRFLFEDSTSLCKELPCSTRSLKKRKETMTRSVSGDISCPKRLRCFPQWLALVEHVTPESSESSGCGDQPLGPFLPTQFESQDPRSRLLKEAEIADALTGLLERTCAANNSFRFREGAKGPYRSEKYPDGSSSIFFSLKKPSIVLRSYILRLVRYMHVSKSVFVVALIYLDRLRHEDELLSLNYLNVHRLLTTALTLAAKYLEDESHRNSTVGRIGGVPSTVEMNMLELQFLRRLGWNCAVSQVAYEAYEKTVFGQYSKCVSNSSERSKSGKGFRVGHEA